MFIKEYFIHFLLFLSRVECKQSFLCFLCPCLYACAWLGWVPLFIWERTKQAKPPYWWLPFQRASLLDCYSRLGSCCDRRKGGGQPLHQTTSLAPQSLPTSNCSRLYCNRIQVLGCLGQPGSRPRGPFKWGFSTLILIHGRCQHLSASQRQGKLYKESGRTVWQRKLRPYSLMEKKYERIHMDYSLC